MADHPFPLSLEARCAEALLAALRADVDLVAWLGGESKIEGIEIEDLRLTGDVHAPELWIAIDSSEETRQASGTADHQVTLAVILVTAHSTQSTRTWVRSSLLGHVKRIVRSLEGGVLRDVDSGEPLTDSLTSFERLRSGRLRQQPTVLVTTLLVAFVAFVDELTGDPV